MFKYYKQLFTCFLCQEFTLILEGGVGGNQDKAKEVVSDDNDGITTDELIQKLFEDGEVSIEDIAAIKESRESEKEVLSQNSIDAIKKYEIDATLKLLDTGILIPEHVKLDNNKLINFLNNITGNCPEDSEVGCDNDQITKDVKPGLVSYIALSNQNSLIVVNEKLTDSGTVKDAFIDVDTLVKAEIEEEKQEPDTDTEKSVGRNFETEEIKDSPLVQAKAIVNQLTLGEGHKVDMPNGVFTIYNEHGSKLCWFDINSHLENPLLSTDGQYDPVKVQSWYEGKIGKFEKNIEKQTEKQAEKQTEKQSETVDIKSIDDLKAALADKKIVKVGKDYYFTPKSIDIETETGLNAIKNDAEGISSLEEVLKTINDLPDVDLAFDESMNEKEKMALIYQVLGRNIEGGHTDKFSTVDLDSDLIDTIYTKEKFEKAVTQELNDLIQDATVTFESGEQDLVDLLGTTTIDFKEGELSFQNTIDPLAKAKLTEIVSKTFKKYGDLKDVKLSFDSKNEQVVNLYSEENQNIFDSLNTESIITLTNGLFQGIPEPINDKVLYTITNGEESVILSGKKLNEVLAANDKKVNKATSEKGDLKSRESIKINDTQLALEELGFTEFKDIDFEGKTDEGKYEFSYEGETVLISADGKTITDEKGNMLKENILKLTESDIKESVKVLQAQEALSEIVKDKEKDDKKEAKEVAKEKQKTLKQQEKDIKKQLSSAEFSVMDLFGKEAKDMRDENGNVNKDDIDKVLWLDEFSKSDLSDELDLNYIKIDLNSDGGTARFDFDDSNGNEDFNEKHTVDISEMTIDGKLDMDMFKVALKDSAAAAVKRMKDAK